MSIDLELLLPRATAWLEREEARVLQTGEPLSPRETLVAQRCGVALPTRVRLLRASRMPEPDDPILRAAQTQANFSLLDAGGLTLRYGIVILDSQWRSEPLVAHELVHVRQYEELGIEGFLRRYLGEVLTVGYANAPMEREAIEVSRRALQLA